MQREPIMLSLVVEPQERTSKYWWYSLLSPSYAIKPSEPFFPLDTSSKWFDMVQFQV
jgi:hypothetical protein